MFVKGTYTHWTKSKLRGTTLPWCKTCPCVKVHLPSRFYYLGKKKRCSLWAFSSNCYLYQAHVNSQIRLVNTTRIQTLGYINSLVVMWLHGCVCKCCWIDKSKFSYPCVSADDVCHVCHMQGEKCGFALQDNRHCIQSAF